MAAKMFYILYNFDDELPACFTNSIAEIQKFLGASSENCASSILCHYFKGDHDRIRDSKGNYYTAAKFKESELV